MSALNSLISHYKTIGFHLAVFNCIVSPARITAHSSWWGVEVVEWQIDKGQAFRFNQLLFHLKTKSMRGLKYSCKSHLRCCRQNPLLILHNIKTRERPWKTKEARLSVPTLSEGASVKRIFGKESLRETLAGTRRGPCETKHQTVTHLWDSDETTTTRAGAERHRTSWRSWTR